MAKLYVHGEVVAEFSKEGFHTFRLMADGVWLKSKPKGWKLARFTKLNPFNIFIEKQFAVKVLNRGRFDELLKASAKAA